MERALRKEVEKPRKSPVFVNIKSPFRDWVEAQGGAAKAALKIGVTKRSVNAWLAAEYSPSIPVCRKIVKLSRGALTIQMIIDHCHTFKAKLTKKDFM